MERRPRVCQLREDRTGIFGWQRGGTQSQPSADGSRLGRGWVAALSCITILAAAPPRPPGETRMAALRECGRAGAQAHAPASPLRWADPACRPGRAG